MPTSTTAFYNTLQAYERSYPVYNFTRIDCGTVHIVVGSGGNNEGLSSFPDGWIDQAWNKTSWCLNPEARQVSGSAGWGGCSWDIAPDQHPMSS